MPSNVYYNGVVIIEDNAFCRCSSFISIFVPPSVTKIGDNIFGECHKLTVYGYAGSYIKEYRAKNGYDIECIKLAGISRNSYYKYRMELKKNK